MMHTIPPAHRWRPVTLRGMAGALLLVLLHGLTSTAQAQALEIQTARLDSVWQFPQRTAPAQVLARNESRLSAEVSGTVLRWTADVGTQVRRGDILVQLDPTDHQLNLQRAEAGLTAAQARLKLGEVQRQRARELVAQGFFSQEALAQRETEVALQQADVSSAQSQVDAARRQLTRTTLRAPFNGTVVQRMVQLGETVSPGTPLLTLAETAATELQASVPPTELDGLQRSTMRRFEPQGSSNDLPVKLLRVTAAVQAGSRTQTVRLGFEGASMPPPGTSGLLLWQDPTPHVPASLVVKRGSALGVMVRDGGVARFVPLPDTQEGRAIAIRLPADTQIVVRGQAALNDGQRID